MQPPDPEHLARFSTEQADRLNSPDLERRVSAAYTLGALPVDRWAAELRSTIVEPSDWLLVSAAIGGALNPPSEWAISIILDCYAEISARGQDAVNDAFRHEVTQQWLAGLGWDDGPCLTLLRRIAAMGEGRSSSEADFILNWVGPEPA